MFHYRQIKYWKPAFHRQTVKTVAYLRVSTAQQDAGSQRLAILEYARKHDLRVVRFRTLSAPPCRIRPNTVPFLHPCFAAPKHGHRSELAVSVGTHPPKYKQPQ